MTLKSFSTSIDDAAIDGKARAVLDALVEIKAYPSKRLVLTLDEPTDWWSLSSHGPDEAADLAEGHGIASLLDAFCAIHNIEMVDL